MHWRLIVLSILLLKCISETPVLRISSLSTVYCCVLLNIPVYVRYSKLVCVVKVCQPYLAKLAPTNLACILAEFCKLHFVCILWINFHYWSTSLYVQTNLTLKYSQSLPFIHFHTSRKCGDCLMYLKTFSLLYVWHTYDSLLVGGRKSRLLIMLAVHLVNWGTLPWERGMLMFLQGSAGSD